MRACSVAATAEVSRGARSSDVGDSLRHALAAVAGRVAVAQFDRFVPARAGARRHDGAANAPPVQWTSTSTVGLPRLSRTSRAWMRWIVGIACESRNSAAGASDFFPPAPAVQQRPRPTVRTASPESSSDRYSTGLVPSMRASRQTPQ